MSVALIERRSVAPRVERIGDAELWLGDCREIAGSLGRVDVTITDPPYGEVTHAAAKTLAGGKGPAALINFDSITDSTLASDCRRWVEMTHRWVILTCDFKHVGLLEADGLPLRRVGIWVKPNSAPQFTGDVPAMGWESIVILHRKGEGRTRWNGGGSRAVWTYNIEKGAHPTQKPLPLVQRWVADFTDDGETVFDPFMGSGTTGVAALGLGRKFLGVEMDPVHFDTACRRIEREASQGRLGL